MSHQPMSETATVQGPLNLSENMLLADLAVRYVNDRMTLGAANKGSDYFWHHYTPWNTKTGDCLEAVRADFKKYKESGTRSNFELIRSNANRALLGGCGNCDEQAMAAFMYLYNRKVRQLDLMVCPKAHVFVVLGRDEKSESNNTDTWGDAAVICDPWDNVSYPPIFRSRMMTCVNFKQMKNTFSGYRVD